ncbi:glycoside hydrolase [Auriculariales sp. MPI-PUGE-AT-0066]|nr:glycoside hydrolase [Auriculariales sp. MPI-PUGE-AT-0066]
MLRSSITAAAVLAGSVSAGAVFGSGFTGKPVISGYWPSYASQLQRPNQIPYNVFTHIDWFVAETTPTYELNFGGPDVEAELRDVVKRAHAAGVTVSACVGGWTGSIHFSDLVANSTSRLAYALSMKRYVQMFKLDGIDLDWEYPSTQGIGCNTIDVEKDSDNFLAFVKTLRLVLGPKSRISAAVGITGIKQGADGALFNRTGELGKYLDYVTIMSYDVYGGWSGTTGPLGPLFDTCATSEGQGASGATGAKLFIDAGFPAKKILLGMPAYSRPRVTASSTLTPIVANGKSSLLYQNVTDELATGGVTTEQASVDVCGVENGASPMWLYRELISTGKLAEDGMTAIASWKRYWDECSQTPFLFNPQNREFIPYDDPQSYDRKAAFVHSHGLAGINMFDLTGDTKDSKLIKAARRRIIGHV